MTFFHQINGHYSQALPIDSPTLGLMAKIMVFTCSSALIPTLGFYT